MHNSIQRLIRRGAVASLCTLLITVLAVPAGATPITIDTVPVGNAGNAGEQSGTGTAAAGPIAIVGGVSYNYRIGTTPVTNAQYTVFLNAVAKTDTWRLYSPEMTDSSHGGITRSGDPGEHTYATKPGMENKPVNFVNWGDAARFTNWLHNGQPTGLQGPNTTEDGAYTLNSPAEFVFQQLNLVTATRNEDARWWIPSEDEWYKAAYHKNDGVTGNYWDYPTGTDTVPAAHAPPGGANSANYLPSLGPSVGTLTDVGAYVDSVSPYGTYDQGGNVWEWTDTRFGDLNRSWRGGSFQVSPNTLSALVRFSSGAPWTNEAAGVGFRVATVPEPGTLLLGMMGGVALLWWSKRRG